MNNKHISTVKKLHCLDLDRKRTGVLILEDGSAELYFVDYENFLHVPAAESTYVVTEEGKVVSLHNNVPGRHSSTSVATKLGGKNRDRKSDEYRRVFHSGIISNLAVIGNDAWRSDDLVRRLTFDVDHTEAILLNGDKVQALGRTSHPSEDDLSLYRVKAKGLTLSAGYAATYRIDTQSVTTYHPTFSIEFDAGVPLNEINRPLFHYSTFFSFVVGGRLSPANVRINRRSLTEMIQSIDVGTYLGDHEIVWNLLADQYDANEPLDYGPPFLAQDDNELAALTDGLATWVNRANEWELAYIGMNQSVGLRHIFSGERLIAAWRWFEKLPNAGAKTLIDKTALEPMILAALKAKPEKIAEPRIRGSLLQLGKESMKDQFERLVVSVKERFGDACLGAQVTAHLMDAREFRGRVAHGQFIPKDETQMKRFHQAMLAMEALCFLLTARDLPLADAGQRRILSHPLVMDYKLASLF